MGVLHDDDNNDDDVLFETHICDAGESDAGHIAILQLDVRVGRVL